MTIVPMGRDHVAAVAALHAASLTGLLTRLGPRAMRAFYDGCVASPLAVGFVALEGVDVSGFVLGTPSARELRRDVSSRNALGVMLGAVVGVFRRPSNLWWLVQPAPSEFDQSGPELMYLAVAPARRGTGLAANLVNEFSAALRLAGHSRYGLSVDEDNARGIAFYERLGFARAERYNEFGAWHVRMRSP